MPRSYDKRVGEMKESKAKSLQELRLLNQSLEVGLLDNNLLESVCRTLETSPEAFLPHAIGYVNWMSFLLYKTNRLEPAKRVALIALGWVLRDREKSERWVQDCTANAQAIFEKQGRMLPPEEVQRIAAEEYGRAVPTPSGTADGEVNGEVDEGAVEADAKQELRLRFDEEDDETVLLFVRAAANGFSGKGSADFWKEQIDEFADALVEVLRSLGNPEPANLSSGTYKDNELDKEALGLTVYRIDDDRQVGVQVRLNPPSPVPRPKSQHAVKLEMVINYGQLGKLIGGLRALLAGHIKEVVVNGDELLP